MSKLGEKERITILIGVALFILATLFPPVYGYGPNYNYHPPSYEFLLSVQHGINYAHLALEWLVIAAGTSIAILLQRGWLKPDRRIKRMAETPTEWTDETEVEILKLIMSSPDFAVAVGIVSIVPQFLGNSSGYKQKILDYEALSKLLLGNIKKVYDTIDSGIQTESHANRTHVEKAIQVGAALTAATADEWWFMVVS